MGKKRVIIVGATGSIGRQSLEVVAAFPDSFEIAGLSAHRDELGLLKAASPWPGSALALSGGPAREEGIAFSGEAGLLEMIRGAEADILVNGAAGAAGLAPSLAALEAGMDLALANKESVVLGWGLLEREAARSGSSVLPVDSEHAAIFQLLARIGREEVEELTITASGGAFRDRPLGELAAVTADEAARHPNWSMGRKITIDSATMANKGLELIEATRLFGFPPERVKVLVHPQSLVHGLVRTRDGTLYANASEPDMRLPIQAALFWPESLPSPFGRLELAGRTLEFREPEAARYPLLGLARAALAIGEGGTIAYNAADEIAVAAFEEGRIGYLGIARLVEAVLGLPWPARATSLREVALIDAEARRAASRLLKEGTWF